MCFIEISNNQAKLIGSLFKSYKVIQKLVSTVW